MNKRNLSIKKITFAFLFLLCTATCMMLKGVTVRAAEENADIVTKNNITYLYVSEKRFETLFKNGSVATLYEFDGEFYMPSTKAVPSTEYNQILNVIRKNDGAYVIIMPYEGTNTSVSIENTINGKPVVLISDEFYSSQIKSLSIPANIIYFDMAVGGLKSLTVSSENNYYTVYQGVLYNKSKTKIEGYIYAMMGSVYNVPNTVKSIPSFPGDKVKTLNIPASVTTIPDYIVSDSIVTVNVDKKNKKFSSAKGVLFNQKKTALLFYPSYKKDKKYTIPKTVKKVSQGAFNNQKYLQTLVMSDKITKIEVNSFCRMKQLKSIQFPKKLKSIGAQAFCGCPKLKSIQFPKELKSIGGYAFSDCPKIKSVTLPASCKSIGRPFDNCKALKTVRINAKKATLVVDWTTVNHTFIIKKGATIKVECLNTDKLTCKQKQILSVKIKDPFSFTITAKKTGKATVSNEFKNKIKFKVVK